MKDVHSTAANAAQAFNLLLIYKQRFGINWNGRVYSLTSTNKLGSFHLTKKKRISAKSFVAGNLNIRFCLKNIFLSFSNEIEKKEREGKSKTTRFQKWKETQIKINWEMKKRKKEKHERDDVKEEKEERHL